MANVHPQNQPPHEDNPLTAMLISLSGSGGPAHETGPPGANELSVRAGHEPDRESPPQHGRNDRDFQHRELRAYAQPRPRTEREVSEPVASGSALG